MWNKISYSTFQRVNTHNILEQRAMVIVHSGQKVITSHGKVVTVAFTAHGQVWAWQDGQLRPVAVRCDAFGGEHDQVMGLAA